jgi:hypothetical protein
VGQVADSHIPPGKSTQPGLQTASVPGTGDWP